MTFLSSYLWYTCTHVFCNAHILWELRGIHEDFGQKWPLEMIDVLVGAKKKVESKTVYPGLYFNSEETQRKCVKRSAGAF